MRKGILKHSDSNEVTTRSKRKELGWGDLTFYEFPNIMGDNPGVSEGVAIEITWKHTSENTIGIDYYEFIRQNRPRRRRKQLIMSSGARDTYLLGLGYSLEQLIRAAEENRKTRMNRRASMKGTTWDKFRNLIDSANGSIRKGTSSSKNLIPKILASKAG